MLWFLHGRAGFQKTGDSTLSLGALGRCRLREGASG